MLEKMSLGITPLLLLRSRLNPMGALLRKWCMEMATQKRTLTICMASFLLCTILPTSWIMWKHLDMMLMAMWPVV